MCTMFAGYYSVTGQLPMAMVVHLAVVVATNELLWERSPFPRVGHNCQSVN